MTPSRVLTAGLAGVALAGCISVLPKTAPAQLYTFGVAAPPAPARGGQFAVEELPVSFERAAATDRILTLAGNEAAYVKGSRWMTGAPELFDAAVTNAFAADGGHARLMARGEAARPDYLLKLDVRTFEVRYDHGIGAPPTVDVEIYAALSVAGERTLAGERLFTARVPATENRAGAIARAFDAAMTQSLGELAKWVDARGA
jgi:cholesterol transport system auxiliary component